MTVSTGDQSTGTVSHAQSARLRQQQLFDHPPRIAPLDRNACAEQLVAATTKLKNAVSCTDGPPVPVEACPEMVATLLKHPDLWDRMSMLSALVQSAHARLPIRQRQLAIMRTVWLCGAPYQWGEHLARTKNAGASDQEMEQLKEGSRAAGWSPLDRAVLAAVEEFHADTFVSEVTWNALAQQFDEQQLLELLVLIGQFTTVAFVLNSLRQPLESHNRGFLAG